MKRPGAWLVFAWAALVAFCFAVWVWRAVKMEDIRTRPQPLGLEEQMFLKDR